MAIPNTKKREIPPTHPGEMLKEDFPHIQASHHYIDTSRDVKQ